MIDTNKVLQHQANFMTALELLKDFDYSDLSQLLAMQLALNSADQGTGGLGALEELLSGNQYEELTEAQSKLDALGYSNAAVFKAPD